MDESYGQVGSWIERPMDGWSIADGRMYALVERLEAMRRERRAGQGMGWNGKKLDGM